MISRRACITGLAGAAASGLPGAHPARAAANPLLATLHEAAKKDGQVTWYIAHIGSAEAEQLAQAFMASYPGVAVNVVRATGQVVYQKLSQDLRAGASNCDVFSSTDLGQYASLSKRRLLMPYQPIVSGGLRPLFREYDPAHELQVTYTGFTSIVYNTSKVKADEAPKAWTDLLDPKWLGKVALGHPAYSGGMGTWTYIMERTYGWGFFDKLAKNKPLIGRSLIDPPTTVANGERLVGIGPSDNILDLGHRGNPVAIVYPADGAIMMINPSSIMQGAPHPNAAKLLLEWLLDKQASTIAATHFLLPVCEAVPPEAGVKRPEEIKIMQASGADLEKGIPLVIEKWRDTFGV